MGCGSSRHDGGTVLPYTESIHTGVLTTATSPEPQSLPGADSDPTTATFGAEASPEDPAESPRRTKDDGGVLAFSPGPSASPLKPVKTPSCTLPGTVSRKGSGAAFSSRSSRVASRSSEDRGATRKLFEDDSDESDSSNVGEPPTPGVYLAKAPPPQKSASLKPLGHPASKAAHRIGPEPLGSAPVANDDGPPETSNGSSQEEKPTEIQADPAPADTDADSAAQMPAGSATGVKPVSMMSVSALPPGLQNWEQVDGLSGYNSKMNQFRRPSNMSVAGLSEFGSLTGWQKIAADIMAGVDAETEAEETAAEAPTPKANHFGQLTKWQTIKTRPGVSFYADYEIISELGAGAYGKALKCQRIADGEIVVAKQILTENMSMKERLETKQEVKVLAHMDHPNVVKYYAAYAEDKEITIVMEYCEEGDLTRFLKQRKGVLLEEHQIMLRFVQVCLALHHVHEKGILHRDLKSSNIFCDTYSILKLGDFGISKMMGAETACRTVVGTPYYLSPEICEDKPYGAKSDMWSLGCVLYELCTLRHAFDGKSLPQLVLKILSGKFPPIANHYSEDLKSLVNSLLSRSPDDRPRLSDIFKSGYVREHMHRYVIHIKKHITKRKESFKRSVATWDHNNLTSFTDTMKGSTRSGQGNNGTIAKRQNSNLADSMIVSVPRTVNNSPPGSRRHMEELNTSMDPPVAGPQTNEDEQQVPGASQPDAEGNTTDGGDNLNLSHCIGPDGMSLLKLGLPPPRFDGNNTNAKSSQDGDVTDNSGSGSGSAPGGVMHLLPSSRWQKGSAHGVTDFASSISHSVATTAVDGTPSDDGTCMGGSGHSSSSTSRATGTSGMSLDKQSTIRRLMQAGAPAAMAAEVANALAREAAPPLVPEDEPAESAPHGLHAMGFMLPGSRYSKHSSYAPSAMGSSSHGEEASVADEDSRGPSRGNHQAAPERLRPAGDTSVAPRRMSEDASPSGSRPHSAYGTSDAADVASTVASGPQLSIKLAPTAPDRQESLVLRAVGRQDSGVGTPQFRMGGGKPPNPSAQRLEGQGSGSTEASSSSPIALGTLNHWDKSPFARNTSMRSSADRRESAYSSADSHSQISSVFSMGPSDVAKGLSRFAQQTSLTRRRSSTDSHEGAFQEAEQTPDIKGPATTAFSRVPTFMRTVQTEGQEFELQVARNEVAKAKSKYEEVKAQRVQEAAARAEKHRQQLLEAKETKENARAAAQHQAAAFVRMLKTKVQTAKPRVPGRMTTRRSTAQTSSVPVTQPDRPQPHKNPNAQARAAARPPKPSSGPKQRRDVEAPSSSGYADFEQDDFFQELAEAGRQANRMERVYGVLDQMTELMEEPPRPGQLQLLPSLRSMTALDLERLEKRINELHKEAKMLLGLNAFNAVRKYIGANMQSADLQQEQEQGLERDTQAELQAIVGAANLAHLPLVLKAVQQEAVYAEAKAAWEESRAAISAA